MRILRGTALNQFGTSYLDRYQRVAELESALKVKRLERDIPKYLRSEFNWLESLEDSMKKLQKADVLKDEEPENTSYQRESMEDQIKKDT